jgi:hypothetical protein
MFTEISAQRYATVAQALPSGPYRLLMLWLALSKDGAQQIYPTADWCRRQLGVSESTYHRWRRWLEDHRLVAIVRRKVSREHNLPNLVRVMSLKQLSAWVWSRIRGLIRKGVTGGIRTPVPYTKKQQLAPKVQSRPWMQSEVYRRVVAKGLGKKGDTT